MVNTVLGERNVYEDFDLESDVLYFKVGIQGIVSFHGRNYNIKKRMTAEQLQQLTSENNFYQTSSNCYINISKIKTISGGNVCFGSDCSESKLVSVNRRKQLVIQHLFTQQSQNKDLSITP